MRRSQWKDKYKISDFRKNFKMYIAIAKEIKYRNLQEELKRQRSNRR